MKLGKIFCFAAVFVLSSCAAFPAQELPECKSALNDFCNMIEREDKGRIAKLLREIEEKTSIRIVIATLETAAPYSADACAVALFEKCAFERPRRAMLFTLYIKERKVSILTTPELSKIFGDEIVEVIEKSAVAPYMIEGRYGEGIYNGLVFMATVISQETGVKFENVKEYPRIYAPVDWERNIFRLRLYRIASIILAMVLVLSMIRLYHTRQFKGKHGYHDIYWWTGGYGGGSGFSIGGFGGFGGGFS